MGNGKHTPPPVAPEAPAAPEAPSTLDAMLDGVKISGRGNGGMGTLTLDASSQELILAGKYQKTAKGSEIVALLKGNRDAMQAFAGCTETEAATIRNVLVGALHVAQAHKGIVRLDAPLRWKRVYVATMAGAKPEDIHPSFTVTKTGVVKL